MSESDTIKEFLIALGFKLDDQSKKTFDGFISGGTKLVENFAAALGLADVAATAFSIKTAQNLDKVYFAAGRLGSSVRDIQSLQYGMSQLGVSSEDALSAMESLANFQRTNPGAKEFLEGWGVLPEHVNNAALSLEDLSKSFQGMSFWQAKPIAEMLGIDDRSLLALQSGQLMPFLDNYSNRLKELGLNEDDAAKKSNALMTEIRQIGSEFKIFGELVTDKLFEPIQGFLNFVINGFKGIDLLISHPKEFGDTAAQMLRNVSPDFMYGKDAIPRGVNAPFSDIFKGQSIQGVAAPMANGSNLSSRDRAMQYFMSQGWTKEQAAGIVANLQRENGTFNPSMMGDHGSAVGIAQWHPDRQAAFASLFGKNIGSASLDEQLAFVQYELTKGSRMNAGNALRGASSAGQAGDIVSRLYESPADVFGEASLRSNMATQIANSPVVNQTNNFNIDGSASPAATAMSVKDRLDDSNKIMARNMGGAVNAWGAVSQ